MYKEEYSTITGDYPNRVTRAITVLRDGVERVAVLDMTRPVTLARMQALIETLSKETGNQFTYISVNHVIFQYSAPEEVVKEQLKHNDYCQYEKPVDKTYQYWRETNTLRIWDHNTLVYENVNGMICSDPDVLADSYC